MIKSFSQAVRYLEQHIPTPDKKHPGELGLRRMQDLMQLLDNPQLKYPTIHVGGTAGKGSTSTFIASILATKYKVGLHTSPHLVKITERIKLNGTDITDTDFIKLVNKIIPFVKEVEKSKFRAPSYFEIVAAMAFLYFMEQKVDFAVIEVGMGGMYDATNVVNPLVAVITNVGLDHTEILGDTVEKIAEDKAGIIKSGVKVVTGARQPSIIEIVESRSTDHEARLSLLGRDFGYKVKKINGDGGVFDYKGHKLLKDLKIRLLGEHQVENAALAIRVIELLNSQTTDPFTRVSSPSLVPPVVNTKEIKLGLQAAFIPGRLEIIKRNPLVILDGAHNQNKVKALAASIKKIFPNKKCTTIIAIKNDKNAKEMLAELLKLSKKIIFTKFRLTGDIGVISSYDPQELLKIAKTMDKNKPVFINNDAKKAVEEAIESAKKNDLILVTGSLYLIGNLKKKLF